MTIENLEKDLKTGNLSNVYVLYGEEKFLLESCIKKIKKNFGELAEGINYIQIDETNINSLISELNTPPFRISKKINISKKCKNISKRNKKEKSNR